MGTSDEPRSTWLARRASFGAVAGEYAQLRPGYPPDVVPFLLGDRPRRVLDLGAGTGLLTDQLLASGHEVVAVDPSAEMLAQLAARQPHVTTEVGGAEAVPLPDASVDAVVAGQAAHWFDVAPTVVELRRVLRPAGLVGLVWNSRDDRVPWVGALSDLLTEEARDHQADEGIAADLARELDAGLDVLDSGIAQRISPEQVVGGIGTRSYVATMDADQRAGFLGRIAELLATHPDTRGRELLDLPYTTRAYRLTLR